jgi:hypothetical protein
LLRFGKALVCAVAWMRLSRAFNAALLESSWWHDDATLLTRCARRGMRGVPWA